MKDGTETQVCDGKEGQNNKEGFLDHTWKAGKAGSQGTGKACNAKKKLKCHQPSSGHDGRCWRHRSAEKKSDDTRVVVTRCRALGQNGPRVPMQGDVAMPQCKREEDPAGFAFAGTISYSR